MGAGATADMISNMPLLDELRENLKNINEEFYNIR